MLASPANVDADIKDHHSDRSPRTRASYTSRRGPIAKPAKKQNSHREQRFPLAHAAGDGDGDGQKKNANVAHFSVASQLESDGLRAYVRAARIGNWATHRRHSAHDTGTRPGLRRCLGGGGSALPEGEPDPCTSVGRTVYTADSAQQRKNDVKARAQTCSASLRNPVVMPYFTGQVKRMEGKRK
jgi:hypothetical protein